MTRGTSSRLTRSLTIIICGRCGGTIQVTISPALNFETCSDTGKLHPFLWKNTEGWPVEFVSVNVAALSGYETVDFTSGKISYLDVIHPEDLKRVSGEVAKFSSEKGRDRFNHEPYRIIAKDGTVK